MQYTKSQLLTKYDLPIGAFEILQGSDKFTTAFVARNGLSVVTPTKDDLFALECGRLMLSGFRGAPLLPFHRFLVLRFLCLPIADVYAELINTGLLASKERFDLAYLKKIHKTIVKRAPKEIQKVFASHEPPKGKVALARFDTFLSIMNIKRFYYAPELVDDLSFMFGIKDLFELLLTTGGANTDIAEFFSKHMKATIPNLTILSYRLLYYAAHELSDDSWKSYLTTIPPGERKAKSDARGKDLIDYAMAKGIPGLASISEVLERTKTKFIRQLGNAQGFQTSAAQTAQKNALDGLLKLDQYTRDVGGTDDADIWKLFERFAVRPPEPQKPRTIQDIRAEQKAKGEESTA